MTVTQVLIARGRRSLSMRTVRGESPWWESGLPVPVEVTEMTLNASYPGMTLDFDRNRWNAAIEDERYGT